MLGGVGRTFGQWAVGACFAAGRVVVGFLLFFSVVFLFIVIGVLVPVFAVVGGIAEVGRFLVLPSFECQREG